MYKKKPWLRSASQVGGIERRNCPVPERPDGEAALPVAPVTGAVGADDAVLLPAAERLAAVGPGGRGVVEEVDVDVAQVDELDCLLELRGVYDIADLGWFFIQLT